MFSCCIQYYISFRYDNSLCKLHFINCIHYFPLLPQSNLGECCILNFNQKENDENIFYVQEGFEVWTPCGTRPYPFRQKASVESYTSCNDLQHFSSTHSLSQYFTLSLSCSLIILLLSFSLLTNTHIHVQGIAGYIF